MEIIYCPQLAYSPPFKFVMAGFLDLLNSGYTIDRLGFNNNSQVVYAIEDEKIVGVSLFNLTPEKEAIEQFSYVDFKYRRRGIYKKLYEQVEFHCKYQKAVVLISFSWYNNEPIKQAVTLLGKEITSIRYSKKIS